MPKKKEKKQLAGNDHAANIPPTKEADVAAGGANGTPAPPGVVSMLPLDRLIAGNDMRRHRPPDEAEIQAMAETIRQRGVLQPLLVRPVGGGSFEIVAGHRRRHAAEIAGLTAIPCIVRAMSDAEVLQVQVAEQLQRVDWHPLDEAEAYKLMRDKHGMTVDQIAAKTGMSTRHVHQRLKLLTLAEPVQQAYVTGKIDYSRARLIARIPDHDQQSKALQEITSNWLAGQNVSALERHINDKYCASLRDAPFPPGDATLTEAGACTACPHYSGNITSEFDNAGGGQDRAHVCTMPSCLDRKVDAWWERRKAAAQASGQQTLDGDQARSGAYVNLDELCRDASKDGKQRTWREALPQEVLREMSPVLIRTGRRVEEAVKLKAAEKALQTAEPKIAAATEAQKESRREQTAKDRAHRQALVSALELIVAEAERADEKRFAALGVTLLVWRTSALGTAAVSKRRGWMPATDSHDYCDYREELLRRIPDLSPAQHRGLMVELLSVDGWSPSGSWGNELKMAAKEFGIDLHKVEADVAKAGPSRAAKKTGGSKR